MGAEGMERFVSATKLAKQLGIGADVLVRMSDRGEFARYYPESVAVGEGCQRKPTRRPGKNGSTARGGKACGHWSGDPAGQDPAGSSAGSSTKGAKEGANFSSNGDRITMASKRAA